MRRQAPALLKRLDLAAVLEWASRGGYAARGLVYLGLGGIVLLAALDLTPRTRGMRGLLAAWSQWPLGSILIGAIGCGLLGFAAWRALQAVFDADSHGRSAKALAIRLGQAVSGVIYGTLAFSAFALLDQLEDFGQADEERSARAPAGRLLATPHGDGLLLLAGGRGDARRRLRQHCPGPRAVFGKRLDCSERLCRRVVVLGRIGYGARGLATLPTGAFLARAGWQTPSSDAHSWAGALQVLEGQPFEWMLAMIAIGLLAFGLFGLVEAAFRRIRPVTPIHQSHGAA